MKRVLIADDHPLVLSGIEAVLQGSRYTVVAKVTDSTDVLRLIATSRPDVLILDVSMPQRSGLDILRALRSRNDARPVVFLTAQLSDAELSEALTLNIQGILPKEGAENLLITCLDEVMRGGQWIERSMLQRALDRAMHGGKAESLLAMLTPRERAIVGLVGRGMRNREVGNELGITEGTVKVSLHRIYEKLGVNSRIELAFAIQDTN